MDQKALISNVATALVTAVVMGVLAWALGVFNAGSDALNEAQIEAVIEKVLIRDNGSTYKASLASIDGSIIAINVKLENIETAVDALAEE